MNNDFLVGVYKEVGKTPDIIKIKNQKDYLEKLLDGEYTTIDYDDYTIIYKKKSNNLLANIYIDQYSKIGISLKGKVFAVSKDENDNFKSLSKDQAKRCISFFLKESFNYKNFDERGRFIPKSKRNMQNRNKNISNLDKKAKLDANNQISINESSTKLNKASDEQILKMILKILFTLLDFIKDTLEDSSDE